MLAGLVDHIISLDEDGEVARAFHDQRLQAGRQRCLHEIDADHQWRNYGRGPVAPHPDPNHNAAHGRMPAPNDADNADEPNDQLLKGILHKLMLTMPLLSKKL